jgi:tRNA(Arg) A34 adenosine deaminase TadA
MTLSTADEQHLRSVIEVAARARAQGNHPFGALLVDENGEVLLEAENTVVTTRDVTGHAELNLVRIASQRYDEPTLRRTTLYASTEPCPMCAGAIFWSGIGRVVFGLSSARFREMLGESVVDLVISSHDLLGRGTRPVEVSGPHLEDQAEAVVAGFWS